MQTAASTLALLGHQAGKTDELVGTRGIEQIAADQKRTAEAKAQVRQTARRATAALVELSQNTVVLGHIQPRWLRAKAEALIEAGEIVDSGVLADLRKAGR